MTKEVKKKTKAASTAKKTPSKNKSTTVKKEPAKKMPVAPKKVPEKKKEITEKEIVKTNKKALKDPKEATPKKRSVKAKEPKNFEAENDPVEVEVIETEVMEEPEIEEDIADEKSLVYVGALQHYLAELRKYPLLNREEEKDFAVRFFEDGDPEAAKRLITSNLRLVVKIAMEYQRAFIQVMDLIQEGNIGLMQAVKKFDPYKGVKLSSYAAWWIKAYILRYILNNWRMVKIGTTQAQRKLFFNLQKERERLEAQGITATPQLIGKQLDVATDTVIEMQQRLGRPDLSIDAPAGEDGKGSVGDLIPNESEGMQDDMLANRQEIIRFREALTEFEIGLNEKEAFIIHHRLLADEPMTLQEIGDELGVTRERIRQLESRLLEKMRDFMIERGLGPIQID